ncbi:MAG TPA: energy-coupling factor transporter ATPase [Candidatus Binataceae bacterium]|nr:energy-coupling factor transporter ATPase [Candidatus Binataceae bacterium]
MKIAPETQAAVDAGGGASQVLAVRAVTFTYHGGARPAVSDLSFAQGRGEMIWVMGASGAGKSTLAKCLNRIVPEFEGGEFRGAVWIGGRTLDSARVCDLAADVGMVFQDFEAQLFATNVAHEVAFAMEQCAVPREEMNARIAPALDAVGLSGFERRDPTSLSGGEKQRLAIASVLALRPSLIVLDEPTTDLDPEGKSEVLALIRSLRAQGLSLIVIEHESEEVRLADRVILMRDGAIIADGATPDVMTKLDLLEECGVHPPSLNRLLALLGLGGHAADVDDAYERIVRAFPRLGEHAASAASDPSRTPAPAPAAPAAGALAEVENVTFAYPGGPPVLNGIDLRIAPGEFIAIVGQNGSGKTTLAKHIVGLLTPGGGRVLLDGRDRAPMRPAETARLAAYVFQNPDHQIFAPTVAEEVAFGPRNFGLAPEEIRRRSDEVLDAVGLDAARDSDPFLLSKGERQRLAVASVLALRPRLLILDEPTTGLDYREQRRMMALVTELNRAGIAIVIITHTPWLVAEYAPRVVLMRRGRKIFDGGVREFFANDELLQTSSFRPPESTRLSRRFGTLALTPAELAAWIREHA